MMLMAAAKCLMIKSDVSLMECLADGLLRIKQSGRWHHKTCRSSAEKLLFSDCPCPNPEWYSKLEISTSDLKVQALNIMEKDYKDGLTFLDIIGEPIGVIN